uniref:Putative secreted protein n=1 Tax=Amblyomma americanum TaxID=6943 RepID=A0A0C9R4H8_AMBAM
MAGAHIRRRMMKMALINLALAFAVGNASAPGTSTKPKHCQCKDGTILQPGQISRHHNPCYAEWCQRGTITLVNITCDGDSAPKCKEHGLWEHFPGCCSNLGYCSSDELRQLPWNAA